MAPRGRVSSVKEAVCVVCYIVLLLRLWES
jgi:hypothetical protein